MGKKWKQWQNFSSGRIFLGLQNHCGWWLQPQNQKILAPSKKSYDKHRQYIKKERHLFANKGKVTGFPVVMYECVHWRIDAFELWCWRRLLRVPWTARRSDQSILKEINSKYSLEGLRLKLKLQNFHHLMWTANSLEKTLMLGKIEAGGEGDREWDGWMASPTQWTWVWTRQWRTGKFACLHCHSAGSQRVEHDLVTEQQQHWLSIGSILEVIWGQGDLFVLQTLYHELNQYLTG